MTEKTDKAFRRHVLRDLRPYVCTYEDCTEADQQYDSIKDWVSHEVNTHRDKKLQPTSPGEQSSNDRGLSQPSKLLAPNDTCRPECPICLEKNPSFVHIGRHLQRFAVFVLPHSARPDEDSIPGDQGSKTANIDDQNSMPSQSTYAMSDKDDLNEDEIDDDWKEWDAKTPAGVAPIEKTRQEDVQRFEHALQQVNKSTRRGLDMNTFFAESELDNALLYQGESNNDGPASVTRQAGSPVPITLSGGNQTYTNLSFYVQIDPLVPNYQEQPIRHGPTYYWAPPNIRTGYTRGNGMLFRWMGGSISPVTANDPIHRAVHQIHSTATVFTQNPDTPHLLVVPFDAQVTHAYMNNGGWRPLAFHHIRIDNTQHTYSAVSAFGDRQHIAAPGPPHWMPQLLPAVYDCMTENPTIQAGLVGSLPILLALAAFSAPSAALGAILTNSLRPGAWQPHQHGYPTGRKCC